MWPQANGQVEVFNRNINGVIRKSFISGCKWEDELTSFLSSYRNTPHCSTKKTLNSLLFINNNGIKLPLINNFTLSDHANNIKEAAQNDASSKAYQKLYADKSRKAQAHNFHIGDKVVQNVMKNKKISNKKFSRFADEQLEIINISGSMITLRGQDNRVFARNASMFKLATYESPSHFLSTDETSLDKTVDDIQITTDSYEVSEPELIVIATPSIEAVIPVVHRSSGRKIVPIDRYIAEPASGLLNKQKA